MAECGKVTENPELWLIDIRCKYSNKQFKETYLTNGPTMFDNGKKLYLKYKTWCKTVEGEEYCSESSSESSSDESEENLNKQMHELEWLQHYITPSLFVEEEIDSDFLDCLRDLWKLANSSDAERQMKWIEQLRSTLSKEEKEDHVINSFFERLDEMHPVFNTNAIYTLHIKLLHIKENIYRVVRVPGSLSLAALQEKILCPLMDWLPNLSIYAFYLPASKYIDHEKPEDPSEDFCLSSADMQDPTGIVFQINRGGRHVVDDRRVAIFQVLWEVGGEIQYHHGNQKHEDSVLRLRITVTGIEQVGGDQEVSMSDAEVLSGRGPMPQEHGLILEDPRYDDSEILGTKAFCACIDIIRNAEMHTDFIVKFARGELKLKEGEPLDLKKFHLAEAKQKIAEASQKYLIKRGMVSPIHAMAFFTMPDSRMIYRGSVQKCMSCGKKENELGRDARKLQRCGRCGNAVYCNEVCQRSDWKTHRNVCVPKKMVPQNKGMIAMCTACGKKDNELGPDQKFRRCGRCGNAAYCDKKCQRKDWTKHKHMCAHSSGKGKQ